jgi:hypothetical protein
MCKKLISKTSLMTLTILLIGACGQTLAQPGEETLQSTWTLLASTWTQKTDMPTARILAGSAVVDGKIYVVGGRSVSSGISKNMEEYDPAADGGHMEKTRSYAHLKTRGTRRRR